MAHLNKGSDQKEWRFTELQKRSSFSHTRAAALKMSAACSVFPMFRWQLGATSQLHQHTPGPAEGPAISTAPSGPCVLPDPPERMAAVSSWGLGIELTVQTRWPHASFMSLYSASSFGQACHGLPVDYAERKIQWTRCMFNRSLVEYVLRCTDLRMPPFL